MIPDIALQITSVVKSLKDNVLPAVDPNNALAQQQLQLSLATLDMVLANFPVIHGALRQDLLQHLRMIEEMQQAAHQEETASSLRQLHAAARGALQSPELGVTQLQEAARELRSGLGELIAKSEAYMDAEALEKIVLKHSDTTLMLGRALNKHTGFEPAPDDVPLVESLLAKYPAA